MNIDIRTIIIAIMLGNLGTAFLVSAAMLKKHKSRANTIFLISRLLQTVAWPLFAYRDLFPDIISILFANIILIIGIILEALALLELKDSSHGWRKNSYFLLGGVSIIAFIVIFLFFNDERIRTIAFALPAAIAVLGPVIAFIRQRRRSILETAFTVAYALVFAYFAFRAINAIFGFITVSIFADHWFNQLSFSLLFLQMVVTNSGYILLSKERVDATLERAATIDQLTQINNRETFLIESKRCITQASHEHKPVSLIMFDIDDFKRVNDKYGHMAGDDVLREIAALVGATVKDCERVSRFGGDEFAVLLPGHDIDASDKRAEALLEKIKAARFTEHNLELAVSIGVVTIKPDKDTTFDHFYRLADEGLYMAKKSAKSGWRRADATLIDTETGS